MDVLGNKLHIILFEKKMLLVFYIIYVSMIEDNALFDNFYLMIKQTV